MFTSPQRNPQPPSRPKCLHACSGLMPLLLGLCLCLAACKVEVFQGLNETQANEMLSILLKNGIEVDKKSVGKTGFTLFVDETKLVQALDILHENNLPRENYKSLGSVFTGQSMISSPTEEQARMAHALSQELADTFSRIDGVLSSRVHVVLPANDQATEVRTPPSAAVFLRHTPESVAVNMVPKIRELTASAVPGLSYDKVTVMLVPMRETLSVPRNTTNNAPLPYALMGILVGLCILGVVLYFLITRSLLSGKKGDQLPTGRGKVNGDGGDAGSGTNHG